MTRLLALLALVASAAIAPSYALAWGAVITYGNGNHFGHYDGQDSPDAAREHALQSCAKNFNDCRFIAAAPQGNFVAVFRGDGLHGIGKHPDPAIAIKAARQDCEKKASPMSCKPVHGAWFGLPGHASFASGSKGLFGVSNQSSFEIASKRAMANCRASGAADCALVKVKSSSDAFLYYSAAVPKNGESHHWSLASGRSLQSASDAAVKICADTYKAQCSVAFTLDNDRYQPAPSAHRETMSGFFEEIRRRNGS